MPACPLVLERYDSVEHLANFEGLIAVILAGVDEIIPVQHGPNLYEALPADKLVWFFEAATFNTMPIEAERDWWGEVIAFLDKSN